MRLLIALLAFSFVLTANGHAVTLSSPTEGMTLTTTVPTFTWTVQPGEQIFSLCDRYSSEPTESDFACQMLIALESGQSSTVAPNELHAGRHWWRVRAADASGNDTSARGSYVVPNRISKLQIATTKRYPRDRENLVKLVFATNGNDLPLRISSTFTYGKRVICRSVEQTLARNFGGDSLESCFLRRKRVPVGARVTFSATISQGSAAATVRTRLRAA